MSTVPLSKSFLLDLEKSLDLFQNDSGTARSSNFQKDTSLEDFILWLKEIRKKEEIGEFSNKEISPIIERLSSRIKIMLLEYEKKQKEQSAC